MNIKLFGFKAWLAAVAAVVLFAAFPVGAEAKHYKEGGGKTVRILAIGNSFSEDAIEQNLYELAEAEGIKVIIGNLYHPGCSLEQHCAYLSEGKEEYDYRKVVDGVKTSRTQTTLDYALLDEDWDYVSFQQASHYSGLWDTYMPWLERVVSYSKKRLRQNVKLMWHMTWAYAADSNHDGFRNYGNSQKKMYEMILSSTRKALGTMPFDILIPCGTAVQNARTSALGDTMNRDGYHLQLCYGRFIAACTWFEAIFKRNVKHNPYCPAGVDAYQQRIAKESAHKAVKRPYRVSRVR